MHVKISLHFDSVHRGALPIHKPLHASLSGLQVNHVKSYTDSKPI